MRAAALLTACLISAGAQAGPFLDAGDGTLAGVPLGTPEAQAVPELLVIFGTAKDTGWTIGCPHDGLDVRVLSWGSLYAEFQEQGGRPVLVRWSYLLDSGTGEAFLDGPEPADIRLPGGGRVGDTFAEVVQGYGGQPSVDENFGVAFFVGEGFAIGTYQPDVTAPITQVGVPTFGFCN
ncbi:MAG: hypothetical protein AAGK00_16505 [Pseudomonadota bacterium]